MWGVCAAADRVAQRGQAQASGPCRVGRHQRQLPAVGARAHRQQPAPGLHAGQHHGPGRDVFEGMRCRQAQFAQDVQPVAFKPEHPLGLDGIAQHGIGRTRHITPTSVGVGLEAGEAVAQRVGWPGAGCHDGQHGQRQDQQPGVHRQVRRARWRRCAPAATAGVFPDPQSAVGHAARRLACQRQGPQAAAGAGAQQTRWPARMQLPHRLICRHGGHGPGCRVRSRRGLRADPPAGWSQPEKACEQGPAPGQAQRTKWAQLAHTAPVYSRRAG